MSKALTVAVTGSTGFVGREIIRALLAPGAAGTIGAVRALVRDREKARNTLPADQRLTLIAGDTGSPATLAELVRGCDACIHLVGILRETGRATFQESHVGATRRVLEACAGARVGRFVHMSALGANPDGTGYQRTKFEAETLVRRSGLDWTIFRPGLIHGPEGELTQMIKSWCSGASQPFFFIPYFARDTKVFTDAVLPTIKMEPPQVAPVSVTDVAKAFVASLSNAKAHGEVYNLVGSQSMSFKAMLEWWRDNLPHAERTLSCVGVPASAAAAQAKVAKLVGLGSLLPFDEGMPIMASEDSTADLTKARAHLGLNPEGFEQSAGKYVGSMS